MIWLSYFNSNHLFNQIKIIVMSDRRENLNNEISPRFLASILKADGVAPQQANNYRKKLLASYYQAESDSA